MSTNSEHEIVLEPSSTHRCECSKAPKTGAHLWDNRRSAKMTQNASKKTFIAAITQLLKVAYPSLMHNKTPTDSGDERNLMHLYC